jgi:protein-S-isoprenylcysteine O-methyltransferase Ste14
MPLLLGSFYGFLVMLMFPIQMNMRIKNEEEVLEKGLEGYSGYKKKVRYKVIPYIW